MSSDLDIGDVEKEKHSSDDDSDESESDEDDKSKSNNSDEESDGKEDKESDEEDEEEEDSDDKKEDNKENEEEEDEKEEKEEKKSKSNKVKEIKLKNSKEGKSSKSKSNKSSSQNKENNEATDIKNINNMIIEKNSSNHTKKETKNRFYIPQYNKRTETLMNILTEDYSSEKNEDNKEEEKIRKEKEIIKKEKEARKKFQKVGDIQFKIEGTSKDLNEFMKKEEMSLQKEKIKFLEEKNMKLDRLNQMYYDIIKEANLDIIRNNSNNSNNNLKFQSLDYINNNNIPNIYNKSLNNLSQDNLDFAIQNYIDGERNKNIHNFNDSMIDINQKITNYLIDNCQEQKDKNRRLENFKFEIGEKLDRIEKIQKKQKHDIDFIIKYGLNKNRALDPIVGLLSEYQRPLPKLLREIDEDNKYDKIMDKKNFIHYKNFSLYGRYSNINKKDDESDKSKKKESGKILRRTGSSIFENRNNPFNYKLKENEGYNRDNPNIKKPFYENKMNNLEIKKRNNKKDEIYEDEEYQKFIAYKGKYFIPADFRFGGVEEKKNQYIKPKRNKNEIDFII